MRGIRSTDGRPREPSAASRPKLHCTARAGWINDPVGLIYRAGTYHLFFQYVPGQAAWAPACRWGHATSTDLLHWTERPAALAPGDGDAGCWSGSVLTREDGDPILFYTSVSPPDFAVGRVRAARPSDADLEVWRKQPGAAVDLPAEVAAVAFRDPFVFEDRGRWWMLVGAGLPDGTATAMTFVSDDLVSWRFEGPVAARHRAEVAPVWTGGMWECPQLVRVGDRHALVVSVWDADESHYVACAVGRFAEGRFVAEGWHRLTWGSSHYAASAFHDKHGRPGLVFWLRGMMAAEGGWSGAISVPFLLTVDGDRPVLVLHESLRAQRNSGGPASAVDAVWRPGSADGELVWVDDAGVARARLRLAGGRVTVDGGVAGGAADMPHTGGELRAVLDGPILEVVGPMGVLAVRVRGGVGTARPEIRGGVGDLAWWALEGRGDPGGATDRSPARDTHHP